jgi:hypothetical protein
MVSTWISEKNHIIIVSNLIDGVRQPGWFPFGDNMLHHQCPRHPAVHNSRWDEGWLNNLLREFILYKLLRKLVMMRRHVSSK